MTNRDHSLADHAVAEDALKALDAQLDRHDFTTTLHTSDDEPPRLAVASQHAQLREDIYVNGECYWWPWGQPIAAIGNPQAAAAKVSYVLGAGPGAGRA